MIVFLSVVLWKKTLCVVQHLIDDSLPVLQPYLPWSVRIRESHEQSLPMIHLGFGHPAGNRWFGMPGLQRKPAAEITNRVRPDGPQEFVWAMLRCSLLPNHIPHRVHAPHNSGTANG
jgi:hypothetical protein